MKSLGMELPEELFATIDTDKDFAISKDELRNHDATAHGKSADAHSAGGSFRRIDTDSDGYFNTTEFRVYFRKLGMETPSDLFRTMDVNGDGRVTEGEFRARYESRNAPADTQELPPAVANAGGNEKNSSPVTENSTARPKTIALKAQKKHQ